eukprot:Gb_14393 [translate_table: standard]
MLGNAAKGPMHRKVDEHQSVHYEKLYKSLFPAILRLATDVELVTRQLFTGFIKQLIHWFTSNTQKENPDSMALLDSVLDGVVDSENGSLREFCAECFAEFMHWSVRHAHAEADNFMNIASMLRRLYARLDHPNPYHRLGATMAAHLIYPILRENGSIVDCHMLEILFFCIKSLRVGENDNDEIGTMKQMDKVMEGMLRLVRRNISTLQKNRRNRKMFSNMQHFLEWLFFQTGRPEGKCRKKCMWLFTSICELLPVGSSASWFKSTFKNAEQVENTLKIFNIKLRFPELSDDGHFIQMLEQWMEEFVCSMHWFDWALKEGLISLTDLFIETREGTVSISSAVNIFLRHLSGGIKYSDLLMTLTPAQMESHGYLRAKAILYFLNFLKGILYVELEVKEQDVNISHDVTHLHLKEDSSVEKLLQFNEPHFQNLMCQLLLNPWQIVCTSLESQSIEELMKLTVKVTTLLSSASSFFKQCFMQSLRNLLSERKFELDLNAFSSSEGTDLVDTMRLLKVYQQLHLAGALVRAIGEESAKSIGQKLLNSLFSIEQECPPALEPVALEMLTLAMALGVTASQLLELVLDRERLIQSVIGKSADNKAGSIFYLNFRKVIVHQLKFSYKECLSVLLQEAVQKFTARLVLNALLDDYLKVESITKASFLREFLQHFHLLSSCCNLEASLTDKLFFLEILQKLFMLDTVCDTVLAENQPYFSFIIESYFLFLNSNHLVSSETSKLLQTSIVMTVKSNALIMVPYFFKSSLDKGIQCRLIDALTKVVTDHLLLHESDIPQGSNERVAYFQMLQRLEGAVLAAKRLELLEVVFPLFQSHVKLARKKVHEILEQYSVIVGDNRGIACDLCLRMLNDCGKVPFLRHAVFHNMFVPMITAAPVDFIVDWYEKHIGDCKQIFDRHPDKVQSTLETEQDYLVVRICYYKLVELLFRRLDAATIKDRITPIVSNQQLMQYAISDSRAKNDPSSFPFPENIALWRELHIAAYNCLAGIVMCTQDQEKLYAFLFKDFSGKPLWQHLVDCSKVYNDSPVETSMLQASYLAVKGMQSERTRSNQGGGGIFSLSSQYLVGATLSQEPIVIHTFLNGSQKSSGDNGTVNADDSKEVPAEVSQGNDLNVTQTEGQELVEKAALDQDDFDRHPSMGIILRLIEHCYHKFGVKQSTETMPEWMKALYLTLDSAVTPMNVCLFIAKIITKSRKVFAPFATTWFRPYVQAILRDPDHSGGRTFHYMLRDMCITVLEWNFPVPPDVPVASNLVNHLISVAAHPSKLVLQANLEIIRLYLQSWKDSINLDRRMISVYLTVGGRTPNTNDKSIGMKRSVGLQLLGVMAASDISFCGVSDDFTFSEDDLCRALRLNVSYKMKNVYEAAAELLGILFKYIEEGKLNIKEQMLQFPLKQTLLSLFQDGDSGQFLNIIDKITLRFPPFLEGYASMVLDLLARIHGVFRVTALNILLRNPHSVPNLFNTIAPFLSKLLTHRDESAQFKSLQLIAELVKDLPQSKIMERVLPVLLETFTSHQNIDCRILYFKILIFLYKEKGMEKNELLRHHLLLGLTDDSDAVRHDLRTFWHSQLSQDLCPRFLQMVNEIYDPDIEECWAQIANNLLLKLCEDSVDFGRPVFSAPLSDCEFHEYTINTSWLGGTLPMTPLFSETQLTAQHSQDNAMQGSQGLEMKGDPKHQQPQMIRATYIPSQSLMLSQTQNTISRDTDGGSSLLALSRNDSTGSFNTLEHEGGALIDTGTKLKRRIFHSSIARPQAKFNALNALRRRESRLAQQSLERANKVQMMRRYRTGELPDIEIAYKDVIIPLSVLAEKDNVFSRLLLIILCRAIYSQQSNELHKSEHELKFSVRDSIEKALQRTKYGISFVGCAMDLCLENKESWIQPKLVGSAAQKSRNFHTGILFLENSVLYETPPEQLHETSRKRHRGSNRRVSREGNSLDEAFVELVKLYKLIGEYDVVLSIYKNNLTKAAITQHALEAQLRGDFNNALQLYDKAINQFEEPNVEGASITEIEQDIWYNQRLQCLVDLNRWQDIMEDTLCQIKSERSEGPDLQSLWSPGIRDPYLGLFIKGSLKVTTYSSLLSDFVQFSLEDPMKRDMLHDEFSTELASWAVINERFDLARFYIQRGYSSFRKQWSSIHPLATVSKHLLVRQLQQIIELDEFVEFTPTRNVKVQLPRLLAAWRNRWPTAEFDDVEAWDDIVQKRLMYFQKSQSLVRKKLGEGYEEFGRQLAAELDSERAHIFYQASRGLMMQGAYDAAQGYMNQYMAAIEGSSNTEKLDFKFYKGLVKLRCLQADRESIVNSYEAIKMLQQVRDYVTTTAEKPKYQSQVQWQNGLKLLQGDVTSQLARVSLKILPQDHGSSEGVENFLLLLGSAYTAYSGLIDEVSNVDQAGGITHFSSKKLAKVYFKFAFFCDELLASTKYQQWGSQVQSQIREGNPSIGLPDSSIYPTLVVKHIMRAVQLNNSMQVQHGIARVLTLLGHYNDTHTEFQCQLKGVPCWLFIAWIPQMLAVIDKDEGGILMGLLEDIAQSYPQALFFPFNVSKSDFGSVGRDRTKKVETLLDNPILKGFTRALEDLTFPEQRLWNGLVHIKNCLSVGNNKGAEEAFRNVFEDCLDVRSMSDDNRKSGEYNLKFARDYSKRILKAIGENGSKLKSMDERHFSQSLRDVMTDLLNCQKNLQVGKLSLSTFSKWMADFDESRNVIRRGSFLLSSPLYSSNYKKEEYNETVVEIPGSYSSFKKPDPSYHVKLMSFDQTLLCLSSKQRPKILKMRGSDEKDYKFVVKGGEDLRLDQRIEQLFDVMNTILRRHSSCAKRKLSLQTYAVIPISKQCGIMQFVEDTRVLEDVIKDGLAHRLSTSGQPISRQGRKTPKDLLSHLRSQYHEWIQKRGASRNPSESYTAMYRKVGADEVTQKMNALTSQLPWDALKTGISRLATSAESFLALRSKFVRSLSVLSICGYVAGVGDRHLSNFLMDIKNGMLVPIDFGYSFGTAVILLPVPELIPFRLTPQFTNLLLPLDSVGLLRNDMVRTLSALHANREIISAVMDVFVNEPLVDWKNEAMKTAAIQQSELMGGDSESQPHQVTSHEQQHVALKIEYAHRKLNLWNPADITISELHSSIHSNKPYLPDLEQIVRGKPECNIRARIQRGICENIEDQVDCLIDQATDPNLVGRIWVGWQPWI